MTCSHRWRPFHHHGLTSALSCLLSVWLLGTGVYCSGVRPHQARDPMGAVTRRSSDLVGQAIEQAQEAEEEQQDVAFLARYNPARCVCPDWEIIYRGRWTRVYLDIEPQAHQRMQRLMETAARDYQNATYAIYTLVGQLSTEYTYAEETGLEYRTLKVVDVGTEPYSSIRAAKVFEGIPPTLSGRTSAALTPAGPRAGQPMDFGIIVDPSSRPCKTSR